MDISNYRVDSSLMIILVQECMEYRNVYIVTNAIIGGAGMIGYSFAFTADFNKVWLYLSSYIVDKIIAPIGKLAQYKLDIFFWFHQDAVAKCKRIFTNTREKG